jgi:predicted HicB family RNase H-like nuclease
MKKKQTPIQIDLDLHKILKVHCAEQGIKINELVQKLLQNYFTKIEEGKLDAKEK